MYLLDRLWRGDLAPSERYIRPGSDYQKLSKTFYDLADTLHTALTPEENKVWEEAERLKSEMTILSEEDIFIYGFRMGARMMLDVVGDHKGQFYEVGEAG